MHMWPAAGFKGPQQWAGAVIVALVVVSAVLQYAGLTRIKAGHKSAWQVSAVVALAGGLAAIGRQGWRLLNPSFFPGSAGLRSGFVGATPVFLVVVPAPMLVVRKPLMAGPAD